MVHSDLGGGEDKGALLRLAGLDLHAVQAWICSVLLVRTGTWWGWGDLDEEVFVVWQMEGDSGGGRTAVGEAEGDSLLRADVNAVKLEVGLK